MRKKSANLPIKAAPCSTIKPSPVPSLRDKLRHLKQTIADEQAGDILSPHDCLDYFYQIEERHYGNKSQASRGTFQTTSKSGKNTSLEPFQFFNRCSGYNKKEGIFVVDEYFNVLYADRQSSQLLQVTKKNLGKLKLTDLVYGQTKNQFIRNFQKSVSNPRFEFDYLIYYHNLAKKLQSQPQFENPSNKDFYCRYLKAIRSKVVEITVDFLDPNKYKDCFINKDLLQWCSGTKCYAVKTRAGIVRDLHKYRFSEDPIIQQMHAKVAASKVAASKVSKKGLVQNSFKIKYEGEMWNTLFEEKSQEIKKPDFEDFPINQQEFELDSREMIKKKVKEMVPKDLFKNKKIVKQYRKCVKNVINLKKQIRDKKKFIKQLDEEKLKEVQPVQPAQLTQPGQEVQVVQPIKQLFTLGISTPNNQPIKENEYLQEQDWFRNDYHPQKWLFYPEDPLRESLDEWQEQQYQMIPQPNYYNFSQIDSHGLSYLVEDFMVNEEPIGPSALASYEESDMEL